MRSHLIETLNAEEIRDFSNLPLVPFVLVAPPHRLLLSETIRPLLRSTIIVTEDDANSDLVYETFFSAGALDILLAPLPATYARAKIKHLLKQTRIQHTRETLNLIKGLVQKPITQTEAAFLKTLLLKGETGASREQLNLAAWRNVIVVNRSVDTHLFNLRRKLEGTRVDIHFRRSDRKWVLVSENPQIRLG
ncbi:MAG: hypothetical protein RBT63_07625 [Bdellovibrionales bacterium]|nr:hypothetical protein [Bdellovibrionales bacterium]